MGRTSKAQDAAQLVAELLNVAKASRSSKELVVGIRNVSSETIGIPENNGEPELLLHPTPAVGDDPSAIAIISYSRWQGLRRSKLYGAGLIVRDDAVLGEVDVRAPDDKPEELHPDHGKNVVLKPQEWIESKDEPELRAAISSMTSESSLRRLWAQVDFKVGELERDVPAAERASKMSPGIKKAINSLPMRYRLVEQLVEERLDELSQITREIPDKIRI